jgi:hypothetical protein
MIGALIGGALSSIGGSSSSSASSGGGLLSGIGGIANTLTGGLLGGVTKTLGNLFSI